MFVSLTFVVVAVREDEEGRNWKQGFKSETIRSEGAPKLSLVPPV